MIGKIVLDLAPGIGNPRNSEGAFIETTDGRILFVYSRYDGDTFLDHDRADLALIESSDGGETFSEPRVVLRHTDVGGTNVMSASLLRMRDGSIGLFYLRKNGETTCVPFFSCSFDEGKTFVRHRRLIREDGYFVLNNDRVIRLSDGRIVMPIAESKYHSHVRDGVKHVFYEPYVVHFYVSRDDGASFTRVAGGFSVAPSETGLQEPGVIEYEKGKVRCFIRTDLGYIYGMQSSGDLSRWSWPSPTAFTAPISPMSQKKVRNKAIAVWNPVPLNGKSQLRGEAWTGARNPLVLAIGEGDEFSAPITIEDDDNRGFCYCSIFETGDNLLLAYCAGGIEDKSTLNRLRIRKISLTELFNSIAKNG